MTSAEDLIAGAKALLLDFDGPMARLMPPPLNAFAAERVRQAAGVPLPRELQDTTDHLAILRRLLDQPEALARAEAEATRVEGECAAVAEPASWLEGLLLDVVQRQVPWAVVTNNSPRAVTAFLDCQHIGPPLVVVGRELSTVASMKPDPSYLAAAAQAVNVVPSEALFVGDSASDVVAGRAIGTPVLGYAKDDRRAAELEAAGAVAVCFVVEAGLGY